MGAVRRPETHSAMKRKCAGPKIFCGVKMERKFTLGLIDMKMTQVIVTAANEAN
jgi:hypothetical protein